MIERKDLVNVYNFDILDNENYYVTEEGILVHNGYKTTEGDKLEEDLQNALNENNIDADFNRDIFGEDGSKLGEIDAETANHIIEATVGKGSKLSQIKKYFTDSFNPNGKDVILLGPNYTNSSAIKDIENTGATVVHSIEDLLDLIK